MGPERVRAEAAEPSECCKVGRCRCGRCASSSSSLGGQQRRRPRSLFVGPVAQGGLPHHVHGVFIEVELLLGVDDDDAAYFLKEKRETTTRSFFFR